MTLIKIGSRFVNMDNVSLITVDKPYQGSIRVFFNDDSNKDFEGQEAEALRWWLTRNSVDVLD
ncbi:MAG TPA: hypothetical protein VHA52_02595, partial [Candidatus Babeliaceae bacterium]|nr:hypothetical protein [Candidatus Babeliaceae bacterium]